MGTHNLPSGCSVPRRVSRFRRAQKATCRGVVACTLQGGKRRTSWTAPQQQTRITRTSLPKRVAGGGSTFLEVWSGMLWPSIDAHDSPQASGGTKIMLPLPMRGVLRKRKCARLLSASRSHSRQLGTWCSAASPVQVLPFGKRIRCGFSECIRRQHRDNGI